MGGGFIIPSSVRPLSGAPLITGNDKERRASSNLQASDGLAKLFERVAFPQIDFLRNP